MNSSLGLPRKLVNESHGREEWRFLGLAGLYWSGVLYSMLGWIHKVAVIMCSLSRNQLDRYTLDNCCLARPPRLPSTMAVRHLTRPARIGVAGSVIARIGEVDNGPFQESSVAGGSNLRIGTSLFARRRGEGGMGR